MNQKGINSRQDLYSLGNKVRGWILDEKNRDDIKNRIIKSSKSIFWDRTLGSIRQGDSLTCENKVTPVMNILKVKKIVIGHTPQVDGINSVCDDSLYRIDFGKSKGFEHMRKITSRDGMTIDGGSEEGKIQYLEILRNPDGTIACNIIKEDDK